MMGNAYTEAMDGIMFDDAEKDELVAMLEDAARSAQTPAPRVRKPRWGLAAAAAAAALVVALGGGVAYASGALVSVGQAVASLFGAAPAPTEIVDKIGRPVNAAASDAGVVITADAIIGDAKSYAVVYSVAREDGAPFEIGEPALEDGILPLMFERADDAIPLVMGSSGASWFYDANPDDNAIQYVEQFSVDPGMGDSVIGRTLSVTFENLQVWGDGGEMRPLAEGRWAMSFVIDYEDATERLASDARFDLNGLDARVDELAVSPVSLSIAYLTGERMPELVGGTMIDAATGEVLEEQGQMSPEDVATMERFMNLGTISLTFADGSVVEVVDAGGGSYKDAGEQGLGEKSLFFDRIIDVDELSSISIGDTVIWTRGA